jgi:uncharacterized membrane protein YhaH (DUF805 family)
MKHLIEEPKESFWTIFKDNNDWNEKSIIGAIAFLVMCIVVGVDLVTGYYGKELVINDYVFNAFTIIVLGCFGISGVENVMGKKNKDTGVDEKPLPEEDEG